MIIETVVTQFSLIISKAKGGVGAIESIRHTWKPFR
jgi:hypothetical protein